MAGPPRTAGHRAPKDADVVLQPLTEKSPFVRKGREIIPKRKDFPKLLCPLIVELDLLDEVTINEVPDVIRDEPVPPRKLRVFSLAPPGWTPANGLWKETNDDFGPAGEWRRGKVRAALRGETSYGTFSPPDALICGPFPIMWLVPDPDFRPRSETLPLYPGSFLNHYFRLWGQIEACDCIFQGAETMLVLIKYSKRQSLIQAALSLWFRFLSYQGAPYPLNVQAVPYRDTMEGLASRLPGYLGRITKDLSLPQRQLFTDLHQQVENMERENQQLYVELRTRYQRSQRKLRLAAKSKSAPPVKRPRPRDDSFHQELLRENL